MSNRVKLFRNGEIKNGGAYRLIPMVEANRRWPKKYRPLSTEADKALLQSIHVGTCVKVVAESVGPTVTQEEIWLSVAALNANKSKTPHIGEVKVVPHRRDYHSLGYNDLIRFSTSDIVDVQLTAIPGK